MKPDIHPQYDDAVFTCSCGAVIQTRATVKTGSLDICWSCHPFYTGKQKIVDTAGRVEKFRRRYEKRAKPASGSITKK